MSRDLCSIGTELVRAAGRRHVCLRLLGGVAVAVRCADVLRENPAIRRRCQDIDLAGYSRNRLAIEGLMKEMEFEPAAELNYLAAGRRLMFCQVSDSVRVDFFLDEFRMCHSFAFGARLDDEDVTLDLADLLLTKLQAVSLAERDTADLCALLLETRNSPMAFDLGRIVGICSHDWGWCTTALMALDRVAEGCSGLVQADRAECIRAVVLAIRNSIRSSPKSLRWRMRAMIGTRLRWYELPDEIALTR